MKNTTRFYLLVLKVKTLPKDAHRDCLRRVDDLRQFKAVTAPVPLQKVGLKLGDHKFDLPGRELPSILHGESNKLRPIKKSGHPIGWPDFFGAGNEARTRYLHLGKVALYQMSYARIWPETLTAQAFGGRYRT